MKIILYFALVVLLLQAGSAKVSVDSLSFEPAIIEAGEEIDIYVKVHESPSTRDVWAGQSPGYSDDTGLAREDQSVFYRAKLIASDDAAIKYITILKGTRTIGHLFVGESWTTPFKVKVREDAPATSYGMEFLIVKTDVNGVENDIALSYKFIIPLKGSVKLNVESVNNLRIGSINDVKIDITNNGGGIARHVTLNSNVSGMVNTLQTSSIYIGKMNKGETKSANVQLFVAGEADTGAFSLPVQISYENSSGSTIYMNQSIGLWIEGAPDIEVRLDSSDTFMRGISGNVDIEVINQGFVDAKFLTLELLPGNGYSVISSEKFYLGSLTSDDTDTEEYKIKIADDVKEGGLPLNVRVIYKSENKDEILTNDHTVDINVLSAKEYASQLSGNGGFSLSKALLAIPAIIIAYLLLWFVYKIINLITGFLNKKIFKKV